MKKYFEFTDRISNKFWEINLTGSKVTIVYGRIGIKNPAAKQKKFSSNGEAKKYTEGKIREKVNKGYVEKKPS